MHFFFVVIPLLTRIELEGGRGGGGGNKSVCLRKAQIMKLYRFVFSIQQRIVSPLLHDATFVAVVDTYFL